MITSIAVLLQHNNRPMCVFAQLVAIGARCPPHGHLAPVVGQDAQLTPLRIFQIFVVMDDLGIEIMHKL